MQSRGLSRFRDLTRTWIALWFGLLSPFAAVALPPLASPVQDPLHGDVYVMGYMDLQPGIGEADYSCDEPHTYDGHNGTDFSLRSFLEMDKGTWVLAAAPGTVHSVRFNQFDRNYEPPYLGSGNFVRVNHDDGSVALYWHLLEDSIAVQPGEPVTVGQRLGLIGSSGASPIPHLHFEVWSGGAPVDPFDGPCNPNPGAWIDQPVYAGEAEFRLLSAGFTDLPLPLGSGVYQLNLGLRPLKDTPLQPVQVADSTEALYLWTHFQGRSGATFTMELLNPEAEIAYSQDLRLFRRREFGWRLQRVPADRLDLPLTPGTWRYRILWDESVIHDQAFQVGEKTLYPPRFYPLGGKAIRLRQGMQRVPLEWEGASAGGVQLIPVAMPDGATIENNALLVDPAAKLDQRIQVAMVVAVDADGHHDSFVVHFIDPQAPVTPDWAMRRPDRLNAALNGAWYNPDTSGQGFFSEYSPAANLLFSAWFSFALTEESLTGRPDWLVGTGAPERQRAVLNLVRADGGRLLNSAAKTSLSQPGDVGTLAMVMNGCRADISVAFSDRDLNFADGGLQRIVNNAACDAYDDQLRSVTARSISGSWYDPTMDGQGLLLDLVDAQQLLYANWFTFDEEGHRTWFALFGDYAEPVSTLDVFEIKEGTFNSPDHTGLKPAGQVEITWREPCRSASLSYTDLQGVVRVSDLVKISQVDCPDPGEP